MNKLDKIELLILKAKGHIKNKTWSLDYAKGYCFGVLISTIDDNNLYDEYAKKIDDLQ